MKLPPATRKREVGLYGRALRTLRAYRNMGQRALADESGFSYGAISKWERGESGITTPNRQILAQALRVPPDVFEALAHNGDPLVKALNGYSRLDVEYSVYNYQQAARKLGVCVNTVRKAVKLGVVTPRAEFRACWFTPTDLQKVSDWQRERAVTFRSRLRGFQRMRRAKDREKAAA